jgi:hypothetical protein
VEALVIQTALVARLAVAMAAAMAARVDMHKATMALALVAEEPLDIQELAALVAPRNSMTLTELMVLAAAAVEQGHLDNMTHIQ